MAKFSQSQINVQKQIQKISQVQIQALNLLAMNTQDVRNEILKALNENPALEIVPKKSENSEFDSDFANIDSADFQYDYDDYGDYKKASSSFDSDKFQQTLEAQADNSETLQSHLLHQLNSVKISPFEYELSEKLIYNLDKNGFYGSMLAPETFLPSRTSENFKILEKCLERIQKMDPVGTCCKNAEESLFVQAKIDGECPKLVLFILDGNLELINPPEPNIVYNKLKNFLDDYKKKSFASKPLLESDDFNINDVEIALKYILHLNLHPAQGYTKDVSNYAQPDIVLIVEKKSGSKNTDNFLNGIVAGDENCYFQIKYASGDLPNLRISPKFSFDTENVQKALLLINNLRFRESTMVLQGCALVQAQKDFFLYGTGNLKPYTQRQLAAKLKISESTVSRMFSKKSNKFIQTQWGLFPANYFFVSGVKSSGGEKKISSEKIIMLIKQILNDNKNTFISDTKLTQILNEKGIKIARRTVTKYRINAGIKNSYKR